MDDCVRRADRGARAPNPLELQQFPPGLELLGEPPSTVDVRVRGASGLLARLSEANLVAELNLSAARAGRRLFPLPPEQVRRPFGVDVVQVNPPTIAMVFERTASRQVPVVAAVDGRPAPGYVVGKIAADPQTVEVAGPESAVARATEALTEPVSVSGARAGVRESVTVGVLNPSLRVNSPHAVTVTVQIAPAPIERTIRDVPVHLRNVAANLSARAVPPVVNVAVRGSREALNRLAGDDIVVYVNLGGLGSGEYHMALKHDGTSDAGVTRIDPDTVQVQLANARD